MRISDWSSDVCSSDLFRPLVVAQTDADGCAQRVAFATGHRIGAIVGGVKGARPVIARQADTAERCGGRGAVGRTVPVDDAGAGVGPELVGKLGGAADQCGGQATALGRASWREGGCEYV